HPGRSGRAALQVELPADLVQGDAYSLAGVNVADPSVDLGVPLSLDNLRVVERLVLQTQDELGDQLATLVQWQRERGVEDIGVRGHVPSVGRRRDRIRPTRTPSDLFGCHAS